MLINVTNSLKWKNFSKTQAVKVNKEEREETNKLFSSKLNILSQNKPSHDELNYPAAQKPSTKIIPNPMVSLLNSNI